MEKIGQKTRNITFYSEKNGKMICLHSRHARDYAKYLEVQSWVERYEAGLPLSQELYAHVSSVGIRGRLLPGPMGIGLPDLFCGWTKGYPRVGCR